MLLVWASCSIQHSPTIQVATFSYQNTLPLSPADSKRACILVDCSILQNPGDMQDNHFWQCENGMTLSLVHKVDSFLPLVTNGQHWPVHQLVFPFTSTFDYLRKSYHFTSSAHSWLASSHFYTLFISFNSNLGPESTRLYLLENSLGEVAKLLSWIPGLTGRCHISITRNVVHFAPSRMAQLSQVLCELETLKCCDPVYTGYQWLGGVKLLTQWSEPKVRAVFGDRIPPEVNNEVL